MAGSYNTTHGYTAGGTLPPEYSTWQAMKGRCFNPNEPAYPNYGGRGITVCDRWRDDFAAFLADMGPRPEGTSIDRIDVNGNYEPGNCRWATTLTQANNKRDNIYVLFNGERTTLKNVAQSVGVKYHRLWNWYVELGANLDEAIRRTRGPTKGRGVRRSGWKRERFDSCGRGHPATPENVRIDRKGARCCRVCDRLRARAKRRGEHFPRPSQPRVGQKLSRQD